MTCSPTITISTKDQQRTGDDEHALVGQAVVADERQDGDDSSEDAADQRAQQNDLIAHAQPVALQEEHNLKALTKHRREAERGQSKE